MKIVLAGLQKRGLPLLLCAVLLVSSLPCMTVFAAVNGDVDGDGTVDMSDAFLLFLYISGKTNLDSAQRARSDYNADGCVDAIDSYLLYRRAAGYEAEPIPLRAGVTAESVYMNKIKVYNQTTKKTFTAETKAKLQQTVAEIVRYEMGMSTAAKTSTEAWKAMAVAAYTMLCRYCYDGSTYSIWMSQDIDLSDTNDKRIYDAVGEVLGVKLAYNDASLSPYEQICQCFYSASSAGVSCTSLSAWGYVQLPYLQSVDSPYDSDEYITKYSAGIDSHTHSFEISMTELLNCVGKYLDETIYYDSRAGEYSFYATEKQGPYWSRTNLYYIRSNGEKRYVIGTDVYHAINEYGKPHAYSQAFTVVHEQNGVLTVQTKGNGHGVGMSQYGAIGYANEAGWNYRQILAHYFSVTDSTPYGIVGPKW